MKRRRGHVYGAVALALMLLATPADAQVKPRKPAAAASGAAGAAQPSPYAQRYAALCAACHGANGRSDMPGVPVLAGQPSFYSITQLFLFREGRRSNEAMTAVAKTLNNADLQGFADFIGALPPVPPPPPTTPPDAGRMRKGQALALEHKCVFCHGADLGGGQQVARIAGQHEDYLRMSLRGFRDGTRPGYTQAMTSAVSHIPHADLDTLAYYAARIGSTATTAAPAASR